MPRGGERSRRQNRVGRLDPYPTEYFLIVTDAKETEKNYINGLKCSFPQNLQNRVAIKFFRTDNPANFVSEALRLKNTDQRYNRHVWILFDRDQVPVFDQVIHDAEIEGIRAAWSNPCIEVWFWAYFEHMQFHTVSSQCIDAFKQVFFQKTGYTYQKNDPNIYHRLCESGDEAKAFQRVELKRRGFCADGVTQCSLMIPSTTVDLLVKEIREKVQ